MCEKNSDDGKARFKEVQALATYQQADSVVCNEMESDEEEEVIADAFDKKDLGGVIGTGRNMAATVIQLRWRESRERQAETYEVSVKRIMYMRKQCSCQIQSSFRGYRARKIAYFERHLLVFHWSYNDSKSTVGLIGDFTEPKWVKVLPMRWCPIRLCHVLETPLPETSREIEYKFIVDGKAVCDGGKKMVKDKNGNINNIKIVKVGVNRDPFVHYRKNRLDESIETCKKIMEERRRLKEEQDRINEEEEIKEEERWRVKISRWTVLMKEEKERIQKERKIYQERRNNLCINM